MSFLEDEKLLSAMKDHFDSVAPGEGCGAVVVFKGRYRFIPCRNLAESPEDFFVLDPECYAKAEEMGEIVAIAHSHYNHPATPSDADRVMCEATGLPWIIMAIPSGLVRVIEPEGYEAPLVGRQFCHGVLDCYTLIRDWHKRERGIEMPDFERRWEWWVNGENLYEDNFEKAGCVEVHRPDMQPEPGDILLMQIASPVINHAGIYLGDGQFLHHAVNRLSSRDVYGGYWRHHTVKIVRHRDLC
jgi:proteasome lid subunit RPN8/RPN11